MQEAAVQAHGDECSGTVPVPPAEGCPWKRHDRLAFITCFGQAHRWCAVSRFAGSCLDADQKLQKCSNSRTRKPHAIAPFIVSYITPYLCRLLPRTVVCTRDRSSFEAAGGCAAAYRRMEACCDGTKLRTYRCTRLSRAASAPTTSLGQTLRPRPTAGGGGPIDRAWDTLTRHGSAQPCRVRLHPPEPQLLASAQPVRAPRSRPASTAMTPEDIDRMLRQVMLKDLRTQCRMRNLSPAVLN